MRPKVEGNSIIVSRSLQGNSFCYCPNQRVFSICLYHFCKIWQIVKTNDRLKSCQSVYNKELV